MEFDVLGSLLTDIDQYLDTPHQKKTAEQEESLVARLVEPGVLPSMFALTFMWATNRIHPFIQDLTQNMYL